MPLHSPDLTLLPLFDRALEEELGVLVRSPRPADLRTTLYNTRKVSGDPRYQELRIFLPRGNEKIFIVKKTVEIEG